MPTLAGRLAMLTALITAAEVTMVGLTSFLPGFNPPDWLRIASMAPLPIFIIASLVLGAIGLKGAARGLAIASLIVTALAVVAMVVMFSVGG